MRSSPRPSVQYATPRPDNCRAAAAPRLPSSSRDIHSNFPVARVDRNGVALHPTVAYSTPLIIRGVVWRLKSGRMPNTSVLNRQATRSLPKFAASI